MSYENFESCIEACYKCASACDNCGTACLQEEDVKKMAKCIYLDNLCAEICRLSASFMAKSGGFGGEDYARQLCGLCGKICEDCGAECDRHDTDHCKRCAEACRKCAEECKNMA